MNSAKRIVVISDLHLGGGRMPSDPGGGEGEVSQDARPKDDEPLPMMSHAEELAAFISDLGASVKKDSPIELVIAGDFIDFLAIPPYASWTPEPGLIATKLDAVAGSHAVVFRELRAAIRNGVRLTILIGNHDLELALPACQHKLLRILNASQHEVVFVSDGRAYQIGNCLIEHGNRYDVANENDWEGVRVLASCQSRNETPRSPMRVSAGSEIVDKVVNPLRRRYPFINLIQPEGELLALLLLCLEPTIKFDVSKIARILNATRLQNIEGPRGTRNVAAIGMEDEYDEELDWLFGRDRLGLRTVNVEVNVSDWARVFLLPNSGGVYELLQNDHHLDRGLLRRIQAIMKRILMYDQSDYVRGPTGPYGIAAERMLSHSIQTVVMGHTHEAREVRAPLRATYINTGTWADIVRVPSNALEATEDGLLLLEAFLRRLIFDPSVRSFEPHFAEVLLSDNGDVLEASLRDGKQ